MSIPPKRGIFQRLRASIVGEQDEVTALIRRMEREGKGFAKLANNLAALLVVLFSAGSLLALFGETIYHFLAEWQRGIFDIPSAIIIGVSFLVVVSMDAGMLWASIQLRLLSSRRAPFAEEIVHILVLGIVAIIEAGTYLYMCVQYEHPTSTAAWALIGARSVMAPILAIYLTLARPIPVTPRDILYHVEMAVGKTLLEEVARITSDTHVSLAKKMQLYAASAVMTPEDRTRLEAMIVIVQSPELSRVVAQTGKTPPDLPPGAGEPLPELEDGMTVEADRERPETARGLRLVPARRRKPRANGNHSGKSSALSRYEKQELLGFAFLDAVPGASQAQLQAEVHCRPTTANKIVTRYRRRQRERA